MSLKVMTSSAVSHEIVELAEVCDSNYEISEIADKPLKKYSIEDDINKLFEAIDIRNSSRGMGPTSKSAMKRPMRQPGPAQISHIGISEPVSIKQALRGLCISQASELAAVKKRISRPSSASPGVMPSAAVKNLVEVTLIPEKNLSQISNKAEEGSIATSGVHKGKPVKNPSKNLDLSKQGLKSQSFYKKKIVPKPTSVSKSVVEHNDRVLVSHCSSKKKNETSQSSKSSAGECSSTSYSEDSCPSGSHLCRPHMSKDLRWEAIHRVEEQHGSVGMRQFKLLRKLGGGDIGTVYLAELAGSSSLFALKVMDNVLLSSKKKMMRAQTEKEILEILDHPFLPTLYAHFGMNKFSFLVTEYCPGGDLHVLRQKQVAKSFPEHAVRFYAAEVLLALEYLHMLGVVYRDLKPENILVREDGHIMLSDFDLSLRCPTNPTLLDPSTSSPEPPNKISSPRSDSSCIDPFCLHPDFQLSCFTPRFLSTTSRTKKLKSELAARAAQAARVIPLPQLVVEPTAARSNSFVGTYEYLAPEIIKGEGHGSQVDWWTFGILLYELLYGRTPFKGSTNEETVSNIGSQCLKFPQSQTVSSHARDLIRRLLKKEPENRMGSSKGAAEIKQHSFFDGLNWALIRCETPPEVPKMFDLGDGGCPDIQFEMF